MTEPATTPIREYGGIEDVFDALRGEGHRVTTPCRLVLEALFRADGPISAQQIVEDASVQDFEPSSAYRNLERLEQLGIIRHVHLGHGPSLYLLVGSGEKEFLLCERCGRVNSVDPSELDPLREQIERDFDYRAHFGHFPIVGLCATCLERESPPAGRRGAGWAVSSVPRSGRSGPPRPRPANGRATCGPSVH